MSKITKKDIKELIEQYLQEVEDNRGKVAELNAEADVFVRVIAMLRKLEEK